ncbi:BZ3500_MvSof-1268-A1-R1_Chr8-2g10094 [Microbotryum saponariae]|uniref:BZ3500_MvSof-1268-A1-R1_Chr8-2g10094 protein n=1 Tax=Microbotryum saponariae TaxID=289078 RepID=A0A2X0L545_9BASI|nr:BZ3500_MvSof-1268-A1-R1_Chr8-2g10094 [Microbotryum saponariae]SDA01771.1 BZ3501_MvSof-1269-A2-R1_Chr8-2g09845 [Microbotryum saponariae]
MLGSNNIAAAALCVVAGLCIVPTTDAALRLERDPAARRSASPSEALGSSSASPYQRQLGLDRSELVKAGYVEDAASAYTSLHRRKRSGRRAAVRSARGPARSDALKGSLSRRKRVASRATPTESDAEETSPTLLRPFDYANDKIRGVSLGGWLVTEPFIKASLYLEPNRADWRIQDEWTFCQYQDREVAATALRDHWDSWMTELDIEEIAEAGLNHIRVPVGYWAVDIDTAAGEPYIPGSLYYLDAAIKWAKKAGLRVLIDLYVSSVGRRGSIEWNKNATNLVRTRNVLKVLADEFSKPEYHNVVTAIQPINEPWGHEPGVLAAAEDYYYDGFQLAKLDGTDPSRSLLYVIHDAFRGVSHWKADVIPPHRQDFMRNSTYEGKVMIDTHIYSIFDEQEIRFSEAQRIEHYCEYGQYLSQITAGGLRPVVGEWSTAPTDCNQAFPGANYSRPEQQIGWPSRYDGSWPGTRAMGRCRDISGNGEKFAMDYREQLGRLWEVQVSTYEQGSGWIMWTWKTETTADFSYQAGLDHGWIPKDVTQRTWQDLCKVSPPQRLQLGTIEDSGEADELPTDFLAVGEKVPSSIELKEDDTTDEPVAVYIANTHGRFDALYDTASTVLLLFADAIDVLFLYIGF